MAEAELPSTVHRLRIGSSELVLVAGDLLAQEAQGILCYSSTSLTLHSAVAKRIVEQGGPVVRADAAKHLPAQVGDALALSAGRLPMRYVLVGVTNELRAPPTLEALRSALRVALARAAALELDRLSLPLLRVRRRLDEDDLLVVTLAALAEHLSGATALRRIVLRLDEDVSQARRALQRVVPLLDTLRRVGSLQAHIQALRAAYEGMAQHSPARHDTLSRELLLRRYRALMQATQLLEAAARPDELPGREGLGVELRATQAELQQVALLLGAALEQELGGQGSS